MRVRVAAVGLAAAVLTGIQVLPSAAAAAPEPSDAHILIIGGQTVTSAPWAAAVSNSTGFTCSGTIIAERWVLTATHCLGSGMSVRVGSVDRSSGGTVSSVASTSTRYDLALLRLATPVTTTYMKMATTNPPVGATTSLYGWGMTCFSRCDASAVLKTATARVTSNTAERDNGGGPAILSSGITGNAWRGDSGGPQIYNGVQVGVASTADGTSQQVYASISASRTWIRSVAGI